MPTPSNQTEHGQQGIVLPSSSPSVRISFRWGIWLSILLSGAETAIHSSGDLAAI